MLLHHINKLFYVLSLTLLETNSKFRIADLTHDNSDRYYSLDALHGRNRSVPKIRKKCRFLMGGFPQSNKPCKASFHGRESHHHPGPDTPLTYKNNLCRLMLCIAHKPWENNRTRFAFLLNPNSDFRNLPSGRPRLTPQILKLTKATSESGLNPILSRAAPCADL